MQQLRTFMHTLRTHLGFGLVISVIIIGNLWSTQAPLDYTINVGSDEYSPIWQPDFRTDVPFLEGFLAAESHNKITYRWMSYKGWLQVLGTGERPLILQINHLDIPPSFVPLAPSTYTLSSATGFTATLPIPITARQYQYLWPASQQTGSLRISWSSDAQPDPVEQRLIATPINTLRIQSTQSSTFVAADWGLIAWWLLGFAGLWWLMTTLNRTWGITHMPTRVSSVASLLVVGLLWTDAPRTQLAAQPFAITVLCGIVLHFLLHWAHTRILAHHDTQIETQTWASITSTIAVIAASMRIFGRIYPGSMPGDIQFHTNRLYELSTGWVFLVSNNRGVDFPYPPLTYLAVIPWIHGAITTQIALQFIAALADALSVIVVYLILRRITNPLWASIGGALYVGVAATLMTTWWSFDSHIYTQFASLVLWYQLIRGGDTWHGMHDFWRQSRMVLLLIFVVFLGHYGFLINTALLLAGLCTIVIAGALLRKPWAQRIVMPLVVVCTLAVITTILLFYTQYLSIFTDQLNTAATGGLQSVTGRTAITPQTVADNILYGGVYAHFGIFPVVVAPIGLWLIGRKYWNTQPILIILMLVSLIIAITFAVFPLVTGVSNSPRWLMFISWIIIASSTLFAQRWWRRGRAAKLSIVLMAGFVICNTLWIWLAPMLWRWRPPEPF